jgi:hypothetical protein
MPKLETEPNRALKSGPRLRERAPPPGGRQPGSYRSILAERLDRLGEQLSEPEASIDAGRVRKLLLALSEDIRARSSNLAGSDYRLVVERLTEIYARGFGRRAKNVLTTTAEDYASLIQTISREYPDHDYSEALGHLFCYMSRLFRTRKREWKTIYDHILSIPDSVEAKQLLNRAFFLEIQEWADAGVENLFSIRRDLYEKIGTLAAKLDQLDRDIERIRGGSHSPGSSCAATRGPNVVDLARAREERLVDPLLRKRQRLLAERRGEEEIVGLIESDILEFEDKLRATRRAYFIRSV